MESSSVLGIMPESELCHSNFRDKFGRIEYVARKLRKEKYLFVCAFCENSNINLLFNVIWRLWREQLFSNNYFGEDKGYLINSWHIPVLLYDGINIISKYCTVYGCQSQSVFPYSNKFAKRIELKWNSTHKFDQKSSIRITLVRRQIVKRNL